MPLMLKKFFTFILPTLLAAFIIYDTFVPVLQFDRARFFRAVNTADKIKNAKTNQASRGIAGAQKVKVPDGTYYSFKENYYCESKTLNRKIAGYFDSYRVKGGVICKTGDQCGNKTGRCYNEQSDEISFTRNFDTLTVGRSKFTRQPQSFPPHCVMPSCGHIPDGCQFDQMAPMDEEGCPQGCGTISCGHVDSGCPAVKCSAPPGTCQYDTSQVTYENACPIDCGVLKCDNISELSEEDTTSASEEVSCTSLECPAAPENCTYVNASLSRDGCKTSCGRLVCQVPRADGVLCPSRKCDEAPAGCHYVGSVPVDENGCQTGCPSISCPKKVPEHCVQPKCEDPGPNCRYDGNSPLDFKGCATGCGQLHCND